MALSEDDIQRFGRQILLRDVGGGGQARLLTTHVRVLGESLGLEVAAGYLAAAGLQVECPVRTAGATTWGARRPGEPLPVRQRIALVDVATTPTPQGLPACFLGTTSLGSPGLSLGDVGACERCVRAWLTGPVFGHGTATRQEQVALGSAAALAVQWWALGVSGAVAVTLDGSQWIPCSPPECHCSPP